MTRSYEINFMENLCLVLRMKWSTYNCQVYGSKQPLSKYTGDEIWNFVEMIPDIIAFINDEFVESENNTCIMKSLELWKQIATFLKRTTIYNKTDPLHVQVMKIDSYKKDMLKYKKLVKQFYAYGTNTFMTRKNDGDSETFYLHTLRYYMYDIIVDTWNTYKLGVGIFTMQGFERRNKESKATLLRTNNKCNIMIQNLVKLFTKFNLEGNS